MLERLGILSLPPESLVLSLNGTGILRGNRYVFDQTLVGPTWGRSLRARFIAAARRQDPAPVAAGLLRKLCCCRAGAVAGPRKVQPFCHLLWPTETALPG